MNAETKPLFRMLTMTGAAVLSFGAALTAQAPAAPPTYAKDVAPIMFAKCAECHRAGEVAPMSLTSYQETRPWAKAVRAKVLSREMPPWHADPRYGKFENDRSLTDREIDTIVKWVDGGSPKGNDADLPKLPAFANGWLSERPPDYVFKMPEIRVEAEGEFPNEYYWVQNPFNEDKLVAALELRPGNREVVHHIRVDIVKPPEGCTVENAKLVTIGGGTCKEPGGANDVITEDGDRYYFAAFVPGRQLDRKAPGTAKRISAGHWVRFNMHYQPNGVVTSDQSMMGVWFANDTVTHEVFTKTAGQSLPTEPDVTRLIAEGREVVRDSGRGGNNGSGRLPNIPPFAENWELIGITPVTQSITLYALSPHMHLRGKDLAWIVTWPDGRKETILSVPKYDFNWQMRYELVKPLKLPAGSTITAIAHFDNSEKNKYNPSPEKEVYWAEQSWDEMFSPFIEYTVDSLSIAATKARQPKR